MSLFPAYNSSTSKADGSNCTINRPLNLCGAKLDNPDWSWLKNESYSTEASKSIPEKEISCNFKESQKPKDGRYNIKAKKKKKADRKEKSSTLESCFSSSQQSSASSSKHFEDQQFFEDKKQEKGNFIVDTLYRPAVPRYSKDNHFFKVYKLIKKKMVKNKKSKRYYLKNPNETESCLNSTDVIYSKEEELRKITEDFNKKLSENPKDIDIWLDYVHFQKTVSEFEQTYRSNPTGSTRVTTERQLAIVERALQSNPANEQLLTVRLQLLEHSLSHDQVAEECSRALVQDPGCIALWRALICSSRNNMARCIVPAVLQAFTKALTRLGQLRIHRPPATVDKNILALVLECGLFLQQAGLWEQLMMLLQLYLGLNLTASGQFTLPTVSQESKLKEQEDSVLVSGLPLSVLWLRIERLRASFHYLPVEDCAADPQRVVFSSDLAGLLQPVIGEDLRLQLVACVFLLLKVPLLPTRHTTLECLGLLQIPSAINNVETLLAAAYPNGFSSLSNCRYLSGSVELVSEPQFVRVAVGQGEFLSMIVSLLQHCADLLPTAHAVLMHTWLLRMYTLLCRLHTLQLAVSTAIVKQARAHAKQLLKQPQFRDSVLLYTEYAMLELASGEVDRAVKVLETAAAAAVAQPDSRHSPPPDVHLLLLSRRLAESLLLKDHVANKEAAVKVLVSVQHGLTPALVMERCMPSASQSLTLASSLQPQYLVEWLACHALYLSLTRSVWDATALLQQYINIIPHNGSTLGSSWVEQLYEVLTSLLYLHTVHTRSGFAILRSTISSALKTFPSNLTLLNTLACLETNSGGGGSPVWKLVSQFPVSMSLARLVLVFVVRHKLSLHTTEEGSHYLRNLLRHLTAEEKTRQCPLVWRLYLQLVAAHNAGNQVKTVFYKAIQACPWVKVLYLDAVKFLPEELPEVQDLLIEKELRLHTTPEELEILRE